MTNRVITDIFCPHCSRRIEIQAGCGVDRLLNAISLQAERFGVEVFCRHCETGFIYRRLRAHSGSTGLPGPHRAPTLKLNNYESADRTMLSKRVGETASP